MINSSMRNSDGGGRAGRWHAQMRSQLLPAITHLAVGTRELLAGLARRRAMVLRQAAHQEQRLCRDARGWRTGQALQAPSGHMGVLLDAQLFLPPAQGAQQLSG